MYILIVWDNASVPYAYGPFPTQGEARQFAFDNNLAYRFEIAQFIETRHHA